MATNNLANAVKDLMRIVQPSSATRLSTTQEVVMKRAAKALASNEQSLRRIDSVLEQALNALSSSSLNAQGEAIMAIRDMRDELNIKP